MSKRPIPYFEPDGSYNERPPRKRKPPVTRFTFDWTTPIAPQIASKVGAADYTVLSELDKALRLLELKGILPGNRLRAARRQVEMKAEAMMRKYSKILKP